MEWLQQRDAPVLSCLDLYPLWFSALAKGSFLSIQELKEIRTFCWQAVHLVSMWPEFFLPNQNEKKKKGFKNKYKFNESDAGDKANSTDTSFNESSKFNKSDKLGKSDKSNSSTFLNNTNNLFEFSGFTPLEEVLDQIDGLMTEDGSIRKDASNLLKTLYEEKQHLTQEIHNSLDRQVKQFSMEFLLQDKYVTTREGRWVLPIKSGKQHEFKGTVHASSDSKRTVFMEPESVILFNNQLCSVENEMRVEVNRLLKKMTTYLQGLKENFVDIYEQLLQIDMYFAQSKLALELNAGAFSFNKGGSIHLYHLRNPLLQLSGMEPVASSLELSESEPLVLISGPNAGGKTVLLKSIGLAVLMSRFGMPICASPFSQLPFFSQVHTVMGDMQNMDENLSTFAAHLRALNGALSLKGKTCLLLIDEICGVTDPEEGMALAKSFIEYYIRNGIWAFVSSHFMGLKIPWKKELPIQYGSMPYHIEKQKPSYQFVSNSIESSFAFDLAKSIGVEDRILKQAYHYLSPEERFYQKNLSELKQIKSSLIQAQERLQEQIKNTEKRQQDYEKKILQLEEEKQKKLERFILDKERHIDTLLSQLEMEKRSKVSQHLSEMKKNLPKILKFNPQLANPKNPQKIKTFTEFQDRFPSGSKVFIPRIGQEGILQEYLGSKGNVAILSQSMRMSLHWSELQQPSSPSFKKGKDFKVSVQMSADGEETKMDLRGLSAEQALQTLEKKLDRALVKGEARLQVIHGEELLKKNYSLLFISLYLCKKMEIRS